MVNSLDKEQWSNVERILRHVLDESKPALELDAVEAVEHYLEHGEYEMAFEGLFLELMKSSIVFDKPTLKKYYKLGSVLGLAKDAVFDPQFWKKFQDYTSGD